jgi:hypothetical protein
LSPLDRMAMRLLHAAARVALRVQSPANARRTVDRVGRWLGNFDGIEAACDAANLLAGGGSCLSRSLAIASRLPGAQVVIGADPRWTAQFTAHAWVEWRSHVVDTASLATRGEIVARF